MEPQIDVDEMIEIMQTEKADTALIVKQLEQVDMAELSAMVSQTLNEPVRVQTCKVEHLGGLDSSLLAGGVYRVGGTAVSTSSGQGISAKECQRDWAIFVKILRSPEGFPLPDGSTLSREYAETQNAFIYWRREAFIADHTLLTDLPAGLATPHSLGITQISATEIGLWQEMLPPDNQTWTLTDYRETAYRLGQWQGQTVITASSNQRQAKLPWLSQNWLSSWVSNALAHIYSMIEELNSWQHPLLLTHFTSDELAQLQRLWATRQEMLTQIDRLPQALCHLDAHRANMMWRDDQLILLDWANVGYAALGEELAAFVGATLWFDQVPIAEAEALETAVFNGYLAGLQAEGWDGDVADVWQAYRCHMPLRYAINALFNMLRTAVEPGFGEAWEQRADQPLVNILSREADYVRFLLGRFAQAGL